MSIIRRPGSTMLYIKVVRDQKQYFFSAKTTDPKLAEQKERDFISELEKRLYFESRLSPEERAEREKIVKAARRGPVPTLQAFAEVPDPKTGTEGGPFWTDFATKHYKNETTRNGAINDIKALLRSEELAGAKLSEITHKMMLDYIELRLDQGRAPATINHEIGKLHFVLEAAKTKFDLIAEVPRSPHRLPEKYIGVCVSKEGEKVYMAAVDQDLFDFALTLMDTALEPGAIARLQWMNVWKDRVGKFKHGKIHGDCQKAGGYRERDAPMSPRLQIAIQERWERAKEARGGVAPSKFDYVFPAARKGQGHHKPLESFRSAHNRLWEKTANWEPLTIQKFRLYDLRHTAITRACRGGANNIELQAFAGWKTLRMSSRYLHPEEQDRISAASKLHQHLAEQDDAVSESTDQPATIRLVSSQN